MSKSSFQLTDYLIIAMLAAMGIAIKGFIVPFAHLITGLFFIPGGVVAGGFYMMFLVLAHAIVGKRGAAFMVSLIQALLVTATGTLGSHGPLSLFTYTLSGIAVELWFLFSRHQGCCALCCFIGGMVANMAGIIAVNLTLFRLPLVPMLLSLCVAALSGGLGGLVANTVARQIEKIGVLRPKPIEQRQQL